MQAMNWSDREIMAVIALGSGAVLLLPGIWGLFWKVWSLGWPEVPGRLEDAQYDEDSDGQFSVKARYSYEYAGRRYEKSEWLVLIPPSREYCERHVRTLTAEGMPVAVCPLWPGRSYVAKRYFINHLGQILGGALFVWIGYNLWLGHWWE